MPVGKLPEVEKSLGGVAPATLEMTLPRNLGSEASHQSASWATSQPQPSWDFGL